MSKPDTIQILHLEDDPADVSLVREILDAGGVRCAIVHVDSRERFASALEEKTFDLVLSDFALPSFDGKSALEIVRGWDPDLPFIFVSGTMGEELAVESLRSGATDYVLKDRPARLVASVHRALAEAAERRKRRNAELGLRASEERYRLLFQSNPHPMWVFDEETLAFLAVNEAACRQYGYAREEFLRMTIREIRPSEDVPALMRQIADESGAYRHAGVWRHRKRDGSILLVEISSYPLLFDGRNAQLVLALDVTEREHAQQRARERTTFLNALLENSPLGILVLDAEHRVRLANPAFSRIFGYSQEEVLGRDPDDLISSGTPDLAEEIRRQSLEVLEGRTVHATTRRRRRDGENVEVELYAVPLIEDGRLIGVYAIYEDTTERHRLEEQLRLSQKMEAIGQLAGGVAHDFNNLLTAILGYSDLLTGQLQESPALLEEVEEIQKAGERAAALTRQLLAFSRRQVLEPKILDLNEVVRNIQKMLGRLIGEDVELSTALADGLPSVRADAGQLEQVIMNLVVNARDAMPRGGRITVETSVVDLDESYVRRHASISPGSHVMLAVADTGVGMDAATRSRIFEPFFTTKGKKGTGLGLATVYGIVKQSGGSIWVYSEPGKGTTFKIYLPPVEGSAPVVEARPLAAARARGTETILLVEDEDLVRTLSRSILQGHGYSVVEASTGAQALELADSYPGAIDLVLTDVVMPDMGAAELVPILRKVRPDARILYMSGYTDDGVIRQGLVTSGSHFLQKPFTPDGLARKIRAVLDARDEIVA
jgi:two-component system, cell cycle sensor histidine kinase and response regulator CckA